MNAKRREDMIDVLPKRIILIRRVTEKPGHDGIHHHT